jgi:osmotically inducible protein OsmC
MAAERTADVSWRGSLLDGEGTIESTGSGAISGLEVTWAARSEPEQSERTSPEELMAAAHAACFCMALSHGLAQAGTPPQELRVKATSTFVPGEGITQMKLDATGKVDGIDEARFLEAAEAARDGCPVSGALKGNVEILLDARLAS